jgi:hypothetical protein
MPKILTSRALRTIDTLGKMLRAGTIDQAMHDAARDLQAAFIIAQLDPLRALQILRVPGTGREPELNERQLHARRRVHEAVRALGGFSSPAGSCVWHVVGLQRSVPGNAGSAPRIRLSGPPEGCLCAAKRPLSDPRAKAGRGHRHCRS